MSATPPGASLLDYLKALPQYLMPGHLISRLTHRFTRLRHPALKNPFTRWFVRHFGIDMAEALHEDPTAYEHFNAFFTRALKPELRPICTEPGGLACPVDGRVSQFGTIREGRIFQAKGHDYSLQTLLGGESDWLRDFDGGQFITIYLSPRDYHRIHMPYDAVLREMIHVPGRLFSVNPATTRVIPGLFARNERVVSLFESGLGPLALVKVGAVNVGSIETVWAGEITPPAGRTVRRWHYDAAQASSLQRGEEMGRFNMGSTVIVLIGRQAAMDWTPGIQPDGVVRLGECIARLANGKNDN